jgi:hypothetical protein
MIAQDVDLLRELNVVSYYRPSCRRLPGFCRGEAEATGRANRAGFSAFAGAVRLRGILDHGYSLPADLQNGIHVRWLAKEMDWDDRFRLGSDRPSSAKDPWVGPLIDVDEDRLSSAIGDRLIAIKCLAL